MVNCRDIVAAYRCCMCIRDYVQNHTTLSKHHTFKNKTCPEIHMSTPIMELGFGVQVACPSNATYQHTYGIPVVAA